MFKLTCRHPSTLILNACLITFRFDNRKKQGHQQDCPRLNRFNMGWSSWSISSSFLWSMHKIGKDWIKSMWDLVFHLCFLLLSQEQSDPGRRRTNQERRWVRMMVSIPVKQGNFSNKLTCFSSHSFFVEEDNCPKASCICFFVVGFRPIKGKGREKSFSRASLPKSAVPLTALSTMVRRPVIPACCKYIVARHHIHFKS